MALAQHILGEKDYAAWYRFKRDPNSHVIVDNGVAEGVEVPFLEVVEAADYVGATEIVLPDCMKDARETMRRTLDERVLSLVPEENRMLVPQGDDWMSWTYCLSVFTDPQTLRARSIGIPKHLEALPGGRAHALQIIKDRGIDKRYEIHLLGVYRKPFHEAAKARQVLPTIRGIDTAAPVAYAQHSVVLNDLRHFSLTWKARVPLGLANQNIRQYWRFCGT